MGPKLEEQIGAHIQTERGAKTLHAGAEGGDPVGHPGTRYLSGGKRARDAPGSQRIARAVVAPHPEGTHRSVLHARPKTTLTHAMVVQVFVRPLAYDEFGCRFDRALAEGTSCTFGESI